MSYFKNPKAEFITAWKLAANSPENKKIRTVCDHTQYCWKMGPEGYGFSNEQQDKFKQLGYEKVDNHSYIVKNGGHYKTDSLLHAEHFLLRNILLGKDLFRGFTSTNGDNTAIKYAALCIIIAIESYQKLEKYDTLEQAKAWIKWGPTGGPLYLGIPIRTLAEYKIHLHKFYVAHVERLVSPFKGTITYDMMLQIDLTELKKI